MSALALCCTACVASGEEPTLVLTHDGPLVVEQLGPVALPHVRLDNGATPHGLLCEVSRPQVARSKGGEIRAVGPGVTGVTCSWEAQQVEFELEVKLATMLSFDAIPHRIRVGESVTVQVTARQGEDVVPLGPSRWESSNAEVLGVSPGRVVGLAPGVAFVTVRARGATAQIQINVAP